MKNALPKLPLKRFHARLCTPEVTQIGPVPCSLLLFRDLVPLIYRQRSPDMSLLLGGKVCQKQYPQAACAAFSGAYQPQLRNTTALVISSAVVGL